MSEEGKSAPGPSPAAPQAPAGGQAAPAQPAEQISIQDFQKIALRTGVVVSAEDHPNADRLLVLKVDIGEAAPRQLIAGVKGTYQAADLVGKQVVVVANMKTAKLRGVESQGMVLAATEESSTVILVPERSVKAGSTVK